MRGFLLDTHIWIWHVTPSPRLPRGLRSLIERSDRCWLSPISVWELALLVERGRVSLTRPLRRWVADAHSHAPVREAPLTAEVAIRSHELELPHRDPADRFLAATALVYDLTVLTVDPNLTEADWLPTRSK